MMRPPIKISTKLVKFLKEEGVFTTFLQNRKVYILKQMEQKSSYIPTTTSGLDHAFDWTETPQGLYFWSNLQTKYQKIQNADN